MHLTSRRPPIRQQHIYSRWSMIRLHQSSCIRVHTARVKNSPIQFRHSRGLQFPTSSHTSLRQESMLPPTVRCRPNTISHLINVTKALPGLYKPINHFSEPHNFHSTANYYSKLAAGCCFPTNSAITRNEIHPFRVGFSLFSFNPNFSTMGGNSSEVQANVHNFTVKDIRGNDVDLSIYKGKALLIVNVASECGLTTSNYKEMNELYAKYKEQGLEILAFPCNQFAGQEPGDNEQIAEVACTRFKAEFPIFDKVEVNGDNAAPIYKFLKSSKGGLLGDNIKWNFTKFLVDKDGNVVDRYAPTTSPLNIEKDIKKILGTA